MCEIALNLQRSPLLPPITPIKNCLFVNTTHDQVSPFFGASSLWRYEIPLKEKNMTLPERKNYPQLGEVNAPYVHAVKHGATLYVSGLTAFGTAAQQG